MGSRGTKRLDKSGPEDPTETGLGGPYELCDFYLSLSYSEPEFLYL